VDIKKKIRCGKVSFLNWLSGIRILGYDASGVVTQVGSATSKFKVGDEVYFAGVHNRQGSNAEFCAVDERLVGKKPKSLPHNLAAGMPLTGITAFEGLLEGLAIPERDKPEEKPKSILVVAGAGGVGAIVIQVAKKLLHLNVIATASRSETADFCKKMGADHIINHHHNLKEQINKLGLPGVDYVFNCYDADPVIEQLIDVINPLGKICLITETCKPVDISHLMAKRGSIVYEMMFTRATANIEPEKQGQILDKLADLLDAGVLQCHVNKTYNLWNDIKQAHLDMESGKTIGKIVLTLE